MKVILSQSRSDSSYT